MIFRFVSRACAALMFAGAPMLSVAQASSDARELVVEAVQCRGNVSTSCAFILGQLYLSAGERLNEDEVENAKLRLSTLRNFQSVDIYLEKGSERGKVLVVVEVKEANPIVQEWLVGLSDRLDSLALSAAGRLSHQNLFGAGKIMDLTFAKTEPVNEIERKSYTAGLRYVDPHLLSSRKYFAVGGISYAHGSAEDRSGRFTELDVLRFGVSVGRRFSDFSYFTVGYGKFPSRDVRSGHWRSDGTFEVEEKKDRDIMDFVYGWNAEDDFYFPTRGSSFVLGLRWGFGTQDDSDELDLQFRKTWQTAGGSLWTVKIGGEPTPEYRRSFNESQWLSVVYASPFGARPDFGGIKRGRWYLEPGLNDAGFRRDGRRILEGGLKAGFRLETEKFGIVDLYLMGSTSASVGNQ